MAQLDGMDVSQGAPERPIVLQAEDKLERGAFVRRLTDALINPTTKVATGVVIGIVGPWGSGKSSVLNVIRESIKARYTDALVVQFDPWLISGRNDLVVAFMREVVRTINSEPKMAKHFKTVLKSLGQYGDLLASLGSLWIPGIGTALKAASAFARQASKSDESPNSLRKRLMDDLQKVSVPIVVLNPRRMQW